MPNLPVVIGGNGVPSVELTDALSSAVDCARAEKSEAARRASDWTDLEVWCRASGAGASPADTATAAAHLASLADGEPDASAIDRRIAALTYQHRQAGLMPQIKPEPRRIAADDGRGRSTRSARISTITRAGARGSRRSRARGRSRSGRLRRSG